MNDRKQYEQTIAGKLDALPLPDMADAIWARIEARLDAELPPDNGSGGNSPNFPTGGFIIGGAGLIMFTVLYLFFKPIQKEQRPVLPLPKQNISTIQPAPTPPSSPPENLQSTKPAALNPTNAAIWPTDPADSIITSSLPPALLQDSAVSAPMQLPVAKATVQQKDTLPPAKKGRGVTGITDNDYRIVPKKDSSNR